MTSWFDLSSIQDQIAKSVEEATKIIEETKNYDILNFDVMAEIEEQEELADADEDEREEDEGEEDRDLGTPVDKLDEATNVSDYFHSNSFLHQKELESGTASVSALPFPVKVTKLSTSLDFELQLDSWPDDFTTDQTQSSHTTTINQDDSSKNDETEDPKFSAVSVSVDVVEDEKKTISDDIEISQDILINDKWDVNTTTSTLSTTADNNQYKVAQVVDNLDNHKKFTEEKYETKQSKDSRNNSRNNRNNNDRINNKNKNNISSSSSSNNDTGIIHESYNINNPVKGSSKRAAKKDRKKNKKDKQGSGLDFWGFSGNSIENDGVMMSNPNHTSDISLIMEPSFVSTSVDLHNEGTEKMQSALTNEHDEEDRNDELENSSTLIQSNTKEIGSGHGSQSLGRQISQSISDYRFSYSFFDKIEDEIDLKDDPILRQVNENKSNPLAAANRQQESLSTRLSSILTLNINSTVNIWQTNPTAVSPVQYPNSSSHPDDHLSNNSYINNTNRKDIEAAGNFAAAVSSRKDIDSLWTVVYCYLVPLSLLLGNLLKTVLLFLYNFVTCSENSPYTRIIESSKGMQRSHNNKPKSALDDLLASEPWQIKLRRYGLQFWDIISSPNGLSVLTGILFLYSYYKFRRYGTDAGD